MMRNTSLSPVQQTLVANTLPCETKMTTLVLPRVLLTRHAIRTNNRGADLFESGSFRAARVCFEHAISSLRDAVSAHAAATTPGDSAPAARPCQQALSLPLLCWSEKAPLFEDTTVFVFSRAIKISMNQQGGNDDGSTMPTTALENLSLSCAVAMLNNLALCLQHIIIQDGSSKSLKLSNIARIYLEAHTLFCSEPTSLHSAIPYHVRIALFCNLGHILHELADDTAAAACFQAMVAEMSKLNSTGWFDLFFPSSEDKYGFVMNSIFKNVTALAA